jgi:hypothetical protein
VREGRSFAILYKRECGKAEKLSAQRLQHANTADMQRGARLADDIAPLPSCLLCFHPAR